jgi:hypothetical protein
VEKKNYQAPVAAKLRIALDETIAATSILSSAAISGKKAAWEPDDTLGNEDAEGGNVYLHW